MFGLGLPFQPVDATLALPISAGVLTPPVRGSQSRGPFQESPSTRNLRFLLGQASPPTDELLRRAPIMNRLHNSRI